MTAVLVEPFLGYPAGTVLRDVTLAEARAMECNRCGDCCNGLRPNVRKDEDTGLPLSVWGSKFPDDLYEQRYGQHMLIPIVMGDGGPQFGEAFEIDADGKPYTAFGCSFLETHGPESPFESTCTLRGREDPADVSTIRPRNCGEFPVFGLDIDAALIDGHTFVPPVGPLPRCSWYGIRIVGPWKDTPYWRERWERQQVGLPVKDFSANPEFTGDLLSRLSK